MHGLGNDFVILDGRVEPVAMTRCARTGHCRPSHRRRLRPADRAGSRAGSDLAMDIWNADGSSAEACGNASRCVVKLTGATTIETAGGVLRGSNGWRDGRSRARRAALRVGRDPACLSDGDRAATAGVGRIYRADGGQCRQSACRLLRRSRSTRSGWPRSGRASSMTRRFPSGSTSMSQASRSRRSGV